MFELAHKYDVARVLGPCMAFLRDPANKLSARRGEPSYVLDWLEVSERLQLRDVGDRCRVGRGPWKRGCVC